MFLNYKLIDFVINLNNMSWGIGQIWSIIKVTVNFVNVEKKVINNNIIFLEKVNKIE